MRKKASPTLLSMARESRGLTQGELAHLVGISQGKISKFEHGMLEVSEGDLADLSRVLDYPQSFFFQDDDSPAAGSGCMYYRKRQSMPVGELRTIHARLRIRCRHIARLLRSAEIDAENKFPRMDVDDYDGGPEEIARLIRANWKLPMGPVANLIIAIENAGGVVIRCSFGTKKLDAISQWASGFPPMFFVNDSISTDRKVVFGA
jgi:transcriptional regulator with XRE-family HTH domain